MAVIVGGLAAMVTEKSRRATVCWPPRRSDPNTLVSPWMSKSGASSPGMAGPSRGGLANTGGRRRNAPASARAAGHELAADLHGARAPRLEKAASRRLKQRGRQPRHPLRQLALDQRGDGLDQRLRVGVERVLEDLLHRRDLDHVAGVHHAHPLDDLGLEA